jgi:hypothetical protein
MKSLAALLSPLQDAIARKNRESGHPAGHPSHTRLDVHESDGLFDVEYRGENELWFDDQPTVTILHDLLSLLASTEIAPHLQSFVYSTDAALAANGTYSIVIDPFVSCKQVFPKLSRFVLDQGEGEHGYKILASRLNGGDGYYDEAGVLARLLDRAPALQELVTSSPPSAEFFLGDPHPLRSLDVDAGFGHEDFIRNLTGCSRFPDLRRLMFTDFRQHHLKDWREQTTSFEDYKRFFVSEIATRVDSIYLREVNLTGEQVRHLLTIRSNGVEIIAVDSVRSADSD